MIDLEKIAGEDPGKLRELRIQMSKGFEPESLQLEALMDLCKKLLMIFNAHAPNIPQADPSWACFLKPEVKPVVRAFGESAYRIAGMGGLYRLCDMFNTVQAKTLGIEDHTSVRELNEIWDGIGDTSGEPIKDYWLS